MGLEVLLQELGLAPEVMLEGYEGHGLAAILIGVIREPNPAANTRQLGVTRDRDEDAPLYHGHLTGRPPRSILTRLADYATADLVIAPVAAQ